MNVKQWVVAVAGLVHLIRAILLKPFDVPGVLFGGIEHVWISTAPSGYDWTYLPRLHVAEVVFVALLTAILLVLTGDRVGLRQKHVGFLTLGAFCLFAAVWFPHSLGGLWFGYVTEIVGDADIILAMSLAFILYLRHDPL